MRISGNEGLLNNAFCVECHLEKYIYVHMLRAIQQCVPMWLM